MEFHNPLCSDRVAQEDDESEYCVVSWKKMVVATHMTLGEVVETRSKDLVTLGIYSDLRLSHSSLTREYRMLDKGLYC